MDPAARGSSRGSLPGGASLGLPRACRQSSWMNDARIIQGIRVGFRRRWHMGVAWEQRGGAMALGHVFPGGAGGIRGTCVR